jgi:pimeloyl-ACP methyl ester carboxylesterase
MPSARQTREPWVHRRVVVNGLRLHLVEAGTGPLVVLLHGFPEFWYCWRHQLLALAVAGFRAVAPDLRGYNESDKPPGVASYHLDLLVGDVADLVSHLGAERAHVVGHDWGGVIAWRLAMLHPALLDRLVILNAPHPATVLRERTNLAQRLRSWYIQFFQLPLLPEWLMQAGDFALMERMLRRQPVHPGAYSPQDIHLYKRALARPGALTASLNYYRAARRYFRATFGHIRPVEAPTLLLWGERDPYLGVWFTEGLERWVSSIRVERWSDSSHWVQNDVPQRVNERLIEFLRAPARKREEDQPPAPLTGQGTVLEAGIDGT